MPKHFYLFVAAVFFMLSACDFFGEEVVKSGDTNHYGDYNNDSNNDNKDCGNGVWDFGEECDGSEVPSCAAWHDDNTIAWEGGIYCNSDCEVIDLCREPEESCNNNGKWEANLGEMCDGDQVPECINIPEFADNVPVGYILSGTIDCSNCKLVSHCTYITDPDYNDENDCNNDGNWEPEYGEECDGTHLPYRYCEEMPEFGIDYAGDVYCEDCRLVAQCIWVASDPPECGDGHIDYWEPYYEECDGSNLDNLTCQSFGRNGGTLRCDQFCQYDFSQCY